MKKVLVIAAAAFLVLGCAANKAASGQDTVTVRTDTGHPLVATNGAIAAQHAPVKFVEHRGMEVSRPSRHEMAVHKAHAEAKARARNTEFWSPTRVRPEDKELREAVQMIKSTAKAVANNLDEPTPTMYDAKILTDRMKRDLVRKMRSMKEGQRMASDEPTPTMWDARRLDLKPSDVRVPANRQGFVTLSPKRDYITREQCKNGSCLDRSRMGRQGLVNCADDVCR